MRSRRRGMLLAVCALLCVLALALRSAAYLRAASAETALSDARDSVTAAVNEAVTEVLEHGGYGYGAFVVLEKDAAGGITALTADTARINRFSAEVLRAVTEKARNGSFDVRIPLGSLLGSDLLMGRGPEAAVRIGMMTSPSVRFESAFSAAGINQTRHSLSLLVRVDVDIYVPWGTLDAAVETQVLIAETVLLGQVPEAYVQRAGGA